MFCCEVAVGGIHGVSDSLTYRCEDTSLCIGSVVIVEVRRKKRLGIVLSISCDAESVDSDFIIKPVVCVLPIDPVVKEVLDFVLWVADYTISSLPSVVSMIFSCGLDFILDIYLRHCNSNEGSDYQIDLFGRKNIRSTSKINTKSDFIVACNSFISRIMKSDDSEVDFFENKIGYSHSLARDNKFFLPRLSDLQSEAYSKILGYSQENKYPVLLDGVTGSGKTLVYLHVIQDMLKDNKRGQILIMLPEIALVAQVVKYIEEVCNFEVVEWHSALTVRQKQCNWLKIFLGHATIVVGTRSALFIPYKNMRFIIVDEEHDASYKQEEGDVIYNARDMSIVMGKIRDVQVLLVSATPSFESINNVNIGKYRAVVLGDRFGHGSLPNVTYVDMKGVVSKYWIIPSVYEIMRKCLTAGKQVGVFLNRRGYAPVSICKECGYRVQCKYCSVYMIEHRLRGEIYLLCHYCGYKMSYVKDCDQCGNIDSFVPYGPGVERIVEEIDKILPEYKTLLMTSDYINTKKKSENAVADFATGKYDIVVGTQMIAKGYNFPKLNLIVIVDADLIGMSGDLRSSERSYQLLHQVSGRVGRFEDKGFVIMQTYSPESNIIQSLLNNDRMSFYKEEMNMRKEIGMPPFSKMICIMFLSQTKEELEKFGKYVVSQAPYCEGISVMGPVMSVIERVKNNYRIRILVKSINKKVKLQSYIGKWMDKVCIPYKIKCKIDVDPYNFI